MARLNMPDSPMRLTFTLNDFSGGLVNNVNDAKMKDSESPDMLNMQFRNDGLIQKRPGLVHVHTCKERTNISDCIPFEFQPNEFVYIYRTPYQLYYESHEGKQIVIWESPVTTLPPPHTDYLGVKICHVHFMNTLMFTDGQNLYKFKFDEETGEPRTYKIVAPPEEFTPNPAPALTGETKENLIGNFKYLHWDFEPGIDYRDETYTQQDENGYAYYLDEEGNRVYQSNFMKWDNSLPGGFLYETWYEPCEYELEDGYKGINLIPPPARLIEVHKDRLYVAGSDYDRNMVWVSDILNPLYFPVSTALSTPPNDDYITALHNYNDTLIIGRRDTIFSLFGNTNRNTTSDMYVLTELNCHTGMANQYSVNKVFHMLFYVGSDGNFYKLHPPSTTSDSFYTTQLNTKIDITLPPFNLEVSCATLSCSEFDAKEGLWYIQLGDHTLVYNYSLMAWTRYNNVNALKFFVVNGKVQYINTFGSIYQMPSKDANQDYFDDVYESVIDRVIKIPINAYWSSRNMDMGQPARVKQFRDTYVTSESFEDYPTVVNVKYEVDYVDIADSFTIENEIAKWDRAIFNQSKFTSRNIDRSLPLMLNRRGRTLKVFYGSGYKYVGLWFMIPEPGSIEEGQIFYSMEDDALFLRVPCRREFKNIKDRYYINLTEKKLNDALLVHNVTGLYELKGYR